MAGLPCSLVCVVHEIVLKKIKKTTTTNPLATRFLMLKQDTLIELGFNGIRVDQDWQNADEVHVSRLSRPLEKKKRLKLILSSKL